jgi:hypothetical protein
MHWTGVDGAFRHDFGLARAQIFLRIRSKFCAATGGAKTIGMSLIVGAMFRGVRIDRHAAYGVDDTLGGVVVMMVMF